jgi:hypothetical protein
MLKVKHFQVKNKMLGKRISGPQTRGRGLAPALFEKKWRQIDRIRRT